MLKAAARCRTVSRRERNFTAQMFLWPLDSRTKKRKSPYSAPLRRGSSFVCRSPTAGHRMNSVCDDPGAFRCGGDQIISRLRSSFSGPSALHVTGRCRAPPTAEGPGEVWWRVGAFTRAPEERNYNGTPGHSAPLGHLFQLGPRLPLLPARLELRLRHFRRRHLVRDA